MRRTLPIILIFLLPIPLQAHVRWFVDDPAQFAAVTYQFDLYTGLVLLGAVLFALITYRLERLTQSENHRGYKLLQQPLPLPPYLEWKIAAAMLGLMLIINVFEGVTFAPNLNIDSDLYPILQGLQIAVYFSLAMSPFVAGSLLFTALALIVVDQPLDLVIDYLFEFAAIAWAMMVIAPASKAPDDKARHCAVKILRIGFGFQLMVLGIHNKLLDPGLGLAFMYDHSFFNFMPGLGFDGFTNLHFVFAAGVAETTLGLLLICGFATRLITLVVAFFFVATAVLMGVEELTGHLPVFAFALIMASHGKTHMTTIEHDKQPHDHVKQPVLIG